MLAVICTIKAGFAMRCLMLQVIRPALLRQGFQLVHSHGLAVTDDVSIIEAMGLPVQVTPGSYTNIKVPASSTCLLERLLWCLCYGLNCCVCINVHCNSR